MSETTASLNLSEDTLYLEGKITYATVSKLVKKGDSFIKSVQADYLNISLKNVTRIDSAGIALLLEWKRHSHHKNLLLTDIPKQAHSLLKAYKLESLFA